MYHINFLVEVFPQYFVQIVSKKYFVQMGHSLNSLHSNIGCYELDLLFMR